MMRQERNKKTLLIVNHCQSKYSQITHVKTQQNKLSQLTIAQLIEKIRNE